MDAYLRRPSLFSSLPRPISYAAEPLSRSKYVFWTQCTVTLHDHQDPYILDEVFKRLDELNARAQRECAR